MGFYAPAQLVRDARAHGVEVRSVDVLASDWESTLETTSAVRLGLDRIHGLSRPGALRLLAARAERRQCHPGQAAFRDVDDLARAARLDHRDLQCLADADALRSLAGHRAQAAWEVAAFIPPTDLLAPASIHEAPIPLPAPTEGEDVLADYRALGIPMGRHPLALLRPWLARRGARSAAELGEIPDGRIVSASGIVTHRQRPETARGTIFVTLEDDTGPINVIVRPKIFDRHRDAIRSARLMTVRGRWQHDAGSTGQVRQLIAFRVVDDSGLLGRLAPASRDFH